jgi:hypothetical protein
MFEENPMSAISVAEAVPQSLYSVERSTQDTDWDDPELIAKSGARAFQYTSPNRPAITTDQSKTDFTVYRGGYQDNQLYYTTTNSDETAIPGAKTIVGPALSVFRGNTFCVYVGTDNSLYWTWTNSTAFSGGSTKFSGHSTGAEPALAAFEGALWCIHTGNGRDNRLFYTKYNGSDWGGNWQSDTPFGNGQTSPSGPALLTVTSVGLVSAYQGNDNTVYYSVWTGADFSIGRRLTSYRTNTSPFLCYLAANELVMLAWKDETSPQLCYVLAPIDQRNGVVLWDKATALIDIGECKSQVGPYLSSYMVEPHMAKKYDVITCSFRGVDK